MFINAVVRNIEIIGEASVRIPDEVKVRFSDIPWLKLKGIRNRIVHDYFGVDVNIIWEIIEKDLVELKKQIELALKS
ncbi:MAG TPA: HepT-like ribonuclease domain-containing protein [Ignavibacteriaceae bacterium]|nr:HepT-like ribonuclease domain-containing protein [Ignavibacteriaceae bacterium]